MSRKELRPERVLEEKEKGRASPWQQKYFLFLRLSSWIQLQESSLFELREANRVLTRLKAQRTMFVMRLESLIYSHYGVDVILKFTLHLFRQRRQQTVISQAALTNFLFSPGRKKSGHLDIY